MDHAGVIPSLDKEGWREAPGWFECGGCLRGWGSLMAIRGEWWIAVSVAEL